MSPRPQPGRRQAIRVLASLPAAAVLPAFGRSTAPLLTRPLPGGGEALPLVGLGSWITFNVGADPQALASCTAVMQAFFAGGGRMIDSSPMYGSAQATVGHGLRQLRDAPVFSADKVWVSSGARGPAQVEASRRLWGVPRFDLLQVHNLLSWEEHLPMLLQMKAAGGLRHVGITTSEGRRHADMERIMRMHPIDFVQLSYNLLDRDVEQRLLPLAQERRIGVIVNRPFRQGALLDALQRHRLPGWATDLGCDGWAQVALKFVVSHPAVSCAIPATTRVDHVLQNLGAARGPLPDAALRQRMAADVKGLLG